MRDLPLTEHTTTFPPRPRVSDALAASSFATAVFTKLPHDVRALFTFVPRFRGELDGPRTLRLTEVLRESGLTVHEVRDDVRGLHWSVETPVGPGRVQLRWTPRGLLAQLELLAEEGLDAPGARHSIVNALQAWAADRYPLEESGTSWDWSDVMLSELGRAGR